MKVNTGQFWDHNPDHYRFVRQLRNPYPVTEYGRTRAMDRIIYGVCLIILALLLMGML